MRVMSWHKSLLNSLRVLLGFNGLLRACLSAPSAFLPSKGCLGCLSCLGCLVRERYAIKTCRAKLNNAANVVCVQQMWCVCSANACFKFDQQDEMLTNAVYQTVLLVRLCECLGAFRLAGDPFLNMQGRGDVQHNLRGFS